MKLHESLSTRREFLATGSAAVMAALIQVGCSTREKIAKVEQSKPAEQPESKEAAETRAYIESLPDEMTIDSGTVVIQKFPVRGSKHLIINMPRFHEIPDQLRLKVPGHVTDPKILSLFKRKHDLELRASAETAGDCTQIARQFIERHGIRYVGREGEVITNPADTAVILGNFDIVREIEKEEVDRAAYIRHLEGKIAALPENDPSIAKYRSDIARSQAIILDTQKKMEPIWKQIAGNNPIFGGLIREHGVWPLPIEGRAQHEAQMQWQLQNPGRHDNEAYMEAREMASMLILSNFGNATGDRKALVSWGADHWKPENGTVARSMSRWNDEHPDQAFSLVIATPPTLAHWFRKNEELKDESRELRREMDKNALDALEKLRAGGASENK